MSAGLQLLRSVIDNGARDIFRGLAPRFFTEDEQPAWNFVSSFFDRYGVLPSPDTCAQNGFHFPPVQGPVAYFRDQLRDRTIYNVYSGQQSNLFDAFQRSDMTSFTSILESMVMEMRSVAQTRDTFTLAEAMQLVMEDFAEAQRSVGLRGVSYGWDTLDEVTGGARRGDLVTIVARPGMGKSFTVARMACMAWGLGANIAFISMEMGAMESARRILAMGSGVSSDLIQRGHVSAWGEEQIRATVARVNDMPPFNMLVGDLSKSVRDVDVMIQEHDPDAIYVDAAYLLKPTQDKKLTKRFEFASETMRELKSLAVSRNKPIIQTVQFNRGQKADEDMSIDNIGQTDEVGQLSSLVLGMRKGAAPHEEVRRSYRVLKNRHGPDGFSFQTTYEHTPFRMDEIADEAGTGTNEDGDYDGTQGAAPARDEWV